MVDLIQPFAPNELNPAAAKKHYKKLSTLPDYVIEENLALVEDIVSFLCSTALKQRVKHAIERYVHDADVRLTYSVLRPEMFNAQEHIAALIDVNAYDGLLDGMPRKKIASTCIAGTQVSCCMLPQYTLPLLHLDECKSFYRYIALSSLLYKLFFEKPNSNLFTSQIMFNAEFPDMHLKHDSLASINIHLTASIGISLAHFDTFEDLIAELCFEGYAPCSTECFR